MNERKYDRLANILVFVAIGSALLFDTGKFSQIAMGVVGGMAGVGAVSLYFLNLRRGSIDKQDVVTNELPTQKIEMGHLRESLAAQLRSSQVQGIWESMVREQFQHYAFHAHCETLARHSLRTTALNSTRYTGVGARYAFLVAKAHAQQQEVVLSPNDVAACAIEIIRHLSSGEDYDRWEFSFGPNGLRVSSKKSQPDRPTNPQENFDFPQMTSTMVQ